MRKIILASLAVVAVTASFAQTAEESKRISSLYNQAKIDQVRKKTQEQEQKRQEILDNYFKTHKLSVSKDSEEKGGRYTIAAITEDGKLVYKTTFNEGSAQTINSRSLNTNLGLNGENLYAGVWDVKIARTTHNEFKETGGGSRVESKDGTTTYYNHSTHVAGTIAGAGVSPAGKYQSRSGKTYDLAEGYSKGIAPAANIEAFDYEKDLLEMISFGAGGRLVSNHSYGVAVVANGVAQVTPNWWGFGAYDYTSHKVDQIAYLNKKYQMVFAAGNDRADYALVNSEKLGYELLTAYATSKNALTVAAVGEVLNYSSPSDVTIASFSNYGPTDDGRIKPNISAKGVDVLSANSTGDSSYYLESGTSMAAPAITGSILLLQQHYKNLNPDYMNSATVRGLLQHTAREAGVSDGPDYSFGWGLADIEAAAQAISENNNGSVVEENKLANQGIYTKKIKVSGTEPLRVSISWTDPEFTKFNGDIFGLSGLGYAYAGVKDPVGANYLVNDLDLKVDKLDANGNVTVTYYPWRLNGAALSAAAKKDGTNDVDNFERVDITNPDGEYLITVSHKKTLSEEQEYTLIVTGSDVETLGIDKFNIKLFDTKVYPVPAQNSVFISINEKVKYTLFEMTGKVLSSGNLKEGKNKIDISGLSSGIYLIKLDNGSKIETKKIIVR